jgi:hypothetical protein
MEIDNLIAETILFLDNAVFPSLAQKWRTEQAGDEQVLPHRLPLKRRLAEFRHGTLLRRNSTTGISMTTASTANPNPNPNSNQNPNSNSNSNPNLNSLFSANLWAIERFRDITPSLVVAVFEDSLVLEPGDIGPLPLSHSVARELVRCINGQVLSLPLLEKLRECGALLYDGCAVIGIVDYRRWAFGTMAAPRSPEVGMLASASTTAPEMHKILLKPSSATIQKDVDNFIREEMGHLAPSTELALDIESRILVSSPSHL